TDRPPVHSLTTLRGLAALWVVVYHFWPEVLVLLPGLALLTPLAVVGNLAVPCFFILSGFVLCYNYAPEFHRLSARDYGRRLVRIYPVHLVTLLAVLAMALVSWRLGWALTDSGYTGRDFVLNVCLVHTWVPDFHLNWNYPSWSISSEWFAYLFFPAVCALL